MTSLPGKTLPLILACATAAGCSFVGIYTPTPETLNRNWSLASITRPYDSNRYAVHDGSSFKVHHGASCASANRGESLDNAGIRVYGIGVEDSISFPTGFDQGTVFLNGWRLRYRDGDHQVFALSSAIVDIEKHDDELRWKAGGILSDKNGDDAFDWCYHYTVMFWRSDALAARLGLKIRADIDDSDDDADLTFLSFDPEHDLSSYRSVRNFAPEPLPNRSAALLPRGFGVMWENLHTSGRGVDHPLLQFSMKYGDTRLIHREDGVSTLFWDHESVFRDKNTNDDYDAAEVVSILHGSGVGYIQPELEIFDSPELGQPTGTRDIFSDTVVVENVPFDHAVPVLTGWDMGDNEKEINIKDIGAWIESFEYERAQGADTGTLIYTVKSVFLDKGGRFSSVGARDPRYQVKILGMNTTDLPTPIGGLATTPIIEPARPSSPTQESNPFAISGP